MQQRFAVESEQLMAQLSPCIRPPHYEIDFAAEIVQQCRDAGVEGDLRQRRLHCLSILKRIILIVPKKVARDACWRCWGCSHGTPLP